MAEFTPVFTSRKVRDHAVVQYQCDCGCKPMAHVYQESAEAGHEHCCCGKVHFAGSAEPMPQMQAYLDQRRAEGEDEGLTYTFGNAEVEAPWGARLLVVYGLPHGEGIEENGHGHEHEHDHDEHAH
jgi:hypothetical protein